MAETRRKFDQDFKDGGGADRPGDGQADRTGRSGARHFPLHHPRRST
jgi:hypothetical protein